MKIAAHRGGRLHAPENTRIALLSGYTAGADVLEMDAQLTRDGRLVVSHDGTIDRLTGQKGKLIDMDWADLRKLYFGATFQPQDVEAFRYPARLELFPELLDLLPRHVWKLIELKHDSSLTTGRRDEFVQKAVEAVLHFGPASRVVFYSKDPDNLRLAHQLAPQIPCAAFDWEQTPEMQIELALKLEAQGLVTKLEDVLTPQGQLTDMGQELERLHASGRLPLGVMLYPFRTPGVFTQAEWETLRAHPFVWSLSTDSLLQVEAFARPGWMWIDEKFQGTAINRELWSLGYAKAEPHRYCKVSHQDGIHVEIQPYDQPEPTAEDAVARRLVHLESQMMYALKNWPFYSGGGVGLVPGILGDFVVEVDYASDKAAQATTLEMAILNVDPGAHQGNSPPTERGKDSFYDPHGAPPYVGVEHDEDDGYRINWNLGSEYDSNQYGKPVGDGKTLTGRFRLERRGAFFAAYYRDGSVAKDWVCVGAVRNDSLNPRVFLRCVGKRWRQEREDNPDEFSPILANTFHFHNLTIRRFPESETSESSDKVA